MAIREDILIRFGGEVSPSLNKSMGAIRGNLRTIGRLAANIGVPLSLSAMATSAVRTGIELQKLERGFTAVYGSAQDAGKQLDYVRDVADRLGQDVLTLSQSWLSFSAAAKQSSLSAEESRRIFEAVSGAMAKLGRSTYETEGALNAIEQMISKGKVSAEELRGQLGERLPGAFQLAANAIGVTTEELNGLLQTGQLTAEELLPKLAAELENTYQTGERVDGLTQSWARFKNELTDVSGEVTDDLLPAIATLVNWLVKGVQVAIDFAKWLGESAAKLQLIFEKLPMIGKVLASPFSQLIPSFGDTGGDNNTAAPSPAPTVNPGAEDQAAAIGSGAYSKPIDVYGGVGVPVTAEGLTESLREQAAKMAPVPIKVRAELVLEDQIADEADRVGGRD